MLSQLANYRPAWAERFYGNGAPDFLVGRHDQPAPPASAAQRETRRAVKRLQKVARRHPDQALELLDIAARLHSCASWQRCHSGACPQCQRATQRWLVWTLKNLSKRVGAPLGAISIIPSTAIAIGAQDSADIVLDLRQQLERALHRSGVRLAVGGIDFSANEHQTGAFEPHLQPHFWLIGRHQDLQRARPQLALLYPRTISVRTAVRVLRLDGDPRAIAYALKWGFVRRVTLPREPGPGGSTSRRQNTRGRDLRLQQHVQLMELLDDLGLDLRVVLIGADITQNRKGRPAIRPRLAHI